MAKTLYNEEGDAFEVPDDEEIASLREQVEAKAALEAELTELKEQSNPNWQEARKKIKALETINANLQKEGKSVNDEGVIVESNAQMTREQIIKEAEQAAVNALLDQRKAQLFSQYDENQRPIVESYFNKLSTGEQLNLNNIENFAKQAEILSFPNQKQSQGRTYNNSFGASVPPAPKKEMDESIKEIGKAMGLTEDDMKKYGN